MLRRRFAHLRSTLLAAAAAVPLACGSDPVEPAIAELAGAYATIEFTVNEGGATANLRQQGATLELVLAADRSVTGRLFIPDGDENGGDLDASMAGTWTVQGDVVRFQQTADTFVRDMPFTVTEVGLRGDATFGGARVVVALQRTP